MKQKLFVLVMALVMMAMSSMKMWADDITFTATEGTAGNGVLENYPKAFDGSTSTKWCVGGLSGTNTIYVEFNATVPLYVMSYTFTTGDDTGSNPTRNPKNWVLQGKVNSTDES